MTPILESGLSVKREIPYVSKMEVNDHIKEFTTHLTLASIPCRLVRHYSDVLRYHPRHDRIGRQICLHQSNGDRKCKILGDSQHRSSIKSPID